MSITRELWISNLLDAASRIADKETQERKVAQRLRRLGEKAGQRPRADGCAALSITNPARCFGID